MFALLFIYVLVGVVLVVSQDQVTGFNSETVVAVLKAPYRAVRELLTN